MNRWWAIAAIALAGLLLGGFGGYFLAGGSNKIAMVDMTRILKESAPAKKYTADLNEQVKAYDAELAKISDTSARAAKSEQYRREVVKLNQEYTDKVVAAADPILARLARERGVQAVFIRESLRFARLDLTEDVLKELGP